MTISEIFAKINAHMIEGMMFHDKMANYYDFLGLIGFKRMHEFRFLSESSEMRGINRYYINHYNMLVPESVVESQKIIPDSWYEYSRKDVNSTSKKSAVKSAADAFCEWEYNTKKLYENCYCDLCEIGEIASACKVKSLIANTDMELKCADRLSIKLASIEYDLPTIFMMQDEIHAEYDKKENEIGVHIC